MNEFLHRHAGSVTGVLSGFDRMRFRGTLRLIANARGLTALLSYLGVLMKDFKHFALDVSAQVRKAAEQVAQASNRPLLYLNSWTTDKEALARQVAARDGVREGLICVLACVERCQSFDLRSDKANGLLLLEPAVRKCQHYYFYHLHERFGFMHLRLQSWLPLNMWACVNGREFLAQPKVQRTLPRRAGERGRRRAAGRAGGLGVQTRDVQRQDRPRAQPLVQRRRRTARSGRTRRVRHQRPA